MSRDKRSTVECFVLLYIVAFHVYYAMPIASAGHSGKPLSRVDMERSTDKIPDLITRDEWGASPPRIWPELVRLEHPVPYVVVSYFNPGITDDKMELQSIQRKHQEAGQSDIQSNFLIGGDGRIYEGRGWEFRPAKTFLLPKFDGKYIEISYIGDFNNKDHTHPIFQATWKVLEFGRDRKYLDENFQILSEKDQT